MRLQVGQRVCVTAGRESQLWATVRHVDLPDDEHIATVDIVLDDGRYGQVQMPRTAIEEPWVPAPIHDLEALEQWLAR